MRFAKNGMKRQLNLRHRQGRVRRLTILLAVLLTLLSACGSQDGRDVEPVFLTEGTEVDASLRSTEWEVTVVDFAGKDTIVGDEGADAGLAQVSQYESSAQRAKRGVWIIIPIRIRNVGEDNLLYSRTLKLVDDQGNEYPLDHRHVHHSFIFFTRPDEYGSDDHMIVQNVFHAGEERQGPAIFDVSLEAKGLKLVLENAEGSIATGY